MENKLKWSLYQVWNESLEAGRPDREVELRDHIWATEIGGSYIDRYLKMKGEEPSNPPNPRSLRKFEAGNLMEWVVGLVLKRAGLFVSEQDWVKFQYNPSLLSVTGKIDFRAGGKVDWEKAGSEVNDLGLPEFFGRATRAIIKNLSEKYPNGLDEIFLGIKSCSSFMFDKYESQGIDKRHAAQEFHYLKATGKQESHNIYICKDDLRMLEFGVFNPSSIEEFYRKDIEIMTDYFKANEMPPKEKFFNFNEENAKFELNWKVSYSPYLTKVYKFENQFAFENTFKGKAAQWNRVFQRCIDGSNMTKLNLDVIKDIKMYFPNFDELVEFGRKKGIAKEEDKE